MIKYWEDNLLLNNRNNKIRTNWFSRNVNVNLDPYTNKLIGKDFYFCCYNRSQNSKALSISNILGSD